MLSAFTLIKKNIENVKWMGKSYAWGVAQGKIV